MKGTQKFKREELRVAFQGWLGWNVRHGLGKESRSASKETGGTGDGYTEEQRTRRIRWSGRGKEEGKWKVMR